MWAVILKGESVKAFIKFNERQTATEEEIMDFCKKNMAGYTRYP